MLSYLLITILASAAAEVVLDGPCPDVKALENFKFSDFQGTWYEIARFSNYEEEGNRGKCTYAEYQVEGDKGKVKNTHVIDGVKSYVHGEITLVESGKVRFTYNLGGKTKNSLLTVLDTDYKNYAIGYSCKNLEDNKHQVFSWILSRNKSLGDSQSKVDAFLANFSAIDKSNFVYNDFSEEACKFTTTRAITDFRRKN